MVYFWSINYKIWSVKYTLGKFFPQKYSTIGGTLLCHVSLTENVLQCSYCIKTTYSPLKIFGLEISMNPQKPPVGWVKEVKPIIPTIKTLFLKV